VTLPAISVESLFVISWDATGEQILHVSTLSRSSADMALVVVRSIENIQTHRGREGTLQNQQTNFAQAELVNLPATNTDLGKVAVEQCIVAFEWSPISQMARVN
jgi:hypothetical protein